MDDQEETNWLAQGCLNRKDRTADCSNKEAEEQLLIETIYKLVLKLNDHTFYDAMVLSENFNDYATKESKRRKQESGENGYDKNNHVWLRSVIRFFNTHYLHMIWWRPERKITRMIPHRYKMVNKGLQCTMKAFTSQPQWSQEEALCTEEQFFILRKRQRCYRDIKELLKRYSRLTKKLYDARNGRIYNQTKGENSDEIDETVAVYDDGIIRKIPEQLTDEKIQEITTDHIMDGLGTEGIYKKLVKKYSKKDKEFDPPSKYADEED